MILGTLRLHECPDPGALLDAAVRLGVRALDTADVYGAGPPHATERRIAAWGGPLPVQSKAGLLRTGPRWQARGTAKHLSTRARESQALLGTIPRFLLHVVDPEVGLDRSWRALQKLREDGVIGALGLSNPRYHEVQRALELGGLDTVQVALSPHRLDALEAGIVRLCLDHGVAVQAHSPLGGYRRRSRQVAAFKALCFEAGVSPSRLSLRWLEALGVEPVVGCSTVAHLEDAMGPVPEEVVAAALDAIPESDCVRAPRPPAAPRGEVVLVAGLPGSGKTTHALGVPGHARLNRDELGGTLNGIVQRLDALLASGERAVVTDNTWADRHLRHRVVRTAARHGCVVRAVHVDTPVDQCLVQAVRRILADGQGLPEPEQLKAGDPPHWFAPNVIFGMAQRFEPLTDDEGFAERVSTAAPPLVWGAAGGVLASLDALEQRAAFDGPLYAALWAPDAARMARVRAALARHPVVDHRICPHPPGPVSCWCRKPLPGMAVDLMLVHGLDPAKLVVVGGSAERTLAARIGAPFEAL
ncbi:MAG: aldo/keto reductase [Alphaproteobacteria bacterium]|nr:aldo/keto reductase [Alphaproteobacteria bacterium]